jgi:hypothetical protein
MTIYCPTLANSFNKLCTWCHKARICKCICWVNNTPVNKVISYQSAHHNSQPFCWGLHALSSFNFLFFDWMMTNGWLNQENARQKRNNDEENQENQANSWATHSHVSQSFASFLGGYSMKNIVVSKYESLSAGSTILNSLIHSKHWLLSSVFTLSTPNKTKNIRKQFERLDSNLSEPLKLNKISKIQFN